MKTYLHNFLIYGFIIQEEGSAIYNEGLKVVKRYYTLAFKGRREFNHEESAGSSKFLKKDPIEATKNEILIQCSQWAGMLEKCQNDHVQKRLSRSFDSLGSYQIRECSLEALKVNHPRQRPSNKKQKLSWVNQNPVILSANYSD